MAARFGHTTRDTCRFCGGGRLEQYIDLGDQPPSNSFIAPDQIKDEQSFPLRVFLCSDCGLSQLLDVVSAEQIFDDYAYLSSTSGALRHHYQQLVDDLIGSFKPDDGVLAIDVGCNDGIMLDRYPVGRFRLLGVEPSSVGEIARGKGLEVVKDFFNRRVAQDIVARHGRAAIITMTNVFAHIDDIGEVVGGLSQLLDESGVLAIEFPYVVDTIDRTLFDTIYHEHLGYIGLTPLQRLLSTVGLAAFRVARIEVGASGPALRVYVGHAAQRAPEASVTDLLAFEESWGIRDLKRYQSFAQDVKDAVGQLRAMVQDLNAMGEKVVAYSAPAKGNTLLNTAGFTAKDIVMVSENNKLKVGKVTPGAHIPVVDDETLMASGAKTALLLSWNYADFFVANSPFVKAGGRFIIPLPRPHLRPS